MWILWRILPLCAAALALWRVIPAIQTGASGVGKAQAITSLNMRSFANSLQGEIGAAAEEAALTAERQEAGMRGQASRLNLDGWNRPLHVRKGKKADTVEVVSCGPDLECGTEDDIIEVVKADGTRKRIEAKPKEEDRAPKPVRPQKS